MTSHQSLIGYGCLKLLNICLCSSFSNFIKMSYVSGSGVIGERSIWRLSFIPEMFWGAVNVVTLFFQTLFEPNLTRRGTGYSSSYSGVARGRPPPAPRRRMGGLGGSCGPMAGGG